MNADDDASTKRPAPPNPKNAGDPGLYFAAERTHLAWIRTGLALMGFGFVVARFGLYLRELAAVQHAVPSHQPRASLWVGTALVLLGVAVNIIASVTHARFVRRFARGETPTPPRFPLAIAVSITLAVIGTAMTVYLLLVH